MCFSFTKSLGRSERNAARNSNCFVDSSIPSHRYATLSRVDPHLRHHACATGEDIISSSGKVKSSTHEHTTVSPPRLLSFRGRPGSEREAQEGEEV